ncbi:Stage II sporulation protein E (SpoIIE) [Blastococcus aurantiacus]|uniref:Stage II sporulation protein E (SpoIIE) n=1 Tax=Blastococcus aurantiacus TaxID=1550231 RepID=A0A1G7Q8W1_9ACTN|nr:PP2C family protein-serine/threonine phosphatase [Blastococcus aurantiacus]SDF94914.1 Stage II sporulation protein E (SpoIIE) [Blastococcus aurantiacus]
MGGSDRIQRALPLGVLILVAALDVGLGRDRVVLTLVVIAPLVAATALGRRATVAHGALAVVVGALLGLYDGLYADAQLTAQVIRLIGIAAGTVAAVVACTLRLRREAEVARLGVEAAAARVGLDTARTLQRHLLGVPPDLPALQSAVRYVPASRHAQVGGDWYDGFGLPDGGTVLVIGDVAGHDAEAAATMAEARGMLRAIARTGPSSPAAVLTGLDDVLTGLRLPTLITLVVATVDGGGGTVTLRWSNAGHPPPVLVRHDGTTELLARTPEPLLGVAAATRRTDHELGLRPGDTLLFYTDGLVERRRWTLDEGTDWLLGQLQLRAREPLDELCDGLLSELGGGTEDDVALLVVRVPAELRR